MRMLAVLLVLGIMVAGEATAQVRIVRPPVIITPLPPPPIIQPQHGNLGGSLPLQQTPRLDISLPNGGGPPSPLSPTVPAHGSSNPEQSVPRESPYQVNPNPPLHVVDPPAPPTESPSGDNGPPQDAGSSRWFIWLVVAGVVAFLIWRAGQK